MGMIVPIGVKSLNIIHLKNNTSPVWLGDNLYIYRVPDQVYQMFFDMIPGHRVALYNSLAVEPSCGIVDPMVETKARILKELKDFITEKFPGMVIVDIADFNKDEAKAIHPMFAYGMYVQLAEGHYEGTIGLQDTLKQLSYEG